MKAAFFSDELIPSFGDLADRGIRSDHLLGWILTGRPSLLNPCQPLMAIAESVTKQHASVCGVRFQQPVITQRVSTQAGEDQVVVGCGYV